MRLTTNRRSTRIGAALVALALVGGLVLQACGSDSSSSTDDTADSTTTTIANTTSLDGVTVTGDIGAKPTVTFDPSYAGTEESVKVVQAGTGPVVETGQLVTFDYVAVSGVDGSELGTNYDQAAQSVIVGGQDLLPIVSTAFVGQPVGSRVMVATNQSGAGETWTIIVFDITSATAIPTSASGEAVEPAAGLPAVTVENGVPTIAKPEGDPPADLVVQPLIKGDGPALAAGQTATIQYVGMIWSSGTVFQSSWTAGAVQLVVGQNIPGFDEGLTGQTVGSRVLIVIPPDKGYGSNGNPQAGIAGTDTIVFVVDILAAS